MRQDPDPSPELIREAKRRLAESDQRFTSARAELISVLSGARRPVSVPELLQSAPGRIPQSSVYRNLTVLCDAGLVRRLNFDEGFVRYELAQDVTGHHHHLVCSNCAAVIDLDDDTLARVEEALGEAESAIATSHGFKVSDHQLDLRGLCRDCA